MKSSRSSTSAGGVASLPQALVARRERAQAAMTKWHRRRRSEWPLPVSVPGGEDAGRA